MVAVVTGGGAGLVNSSRDLLGGAGELGDASTGRAGEKVTVNAGNGNLIIQDRDEYLVGVGPDVDLLRTYNSQGGWDGDNGDCWRIGYYRKVYDLGGGTIKRAEADGRVTTYAWDGASKYVTKDGSGQYDALSYDSPSDSWTWRDGDTGVTETYQLAGSGSYRLTRVTDPEGHYVEVSYSGALISQIATVKAGGTVAGVIKLIYDGTKLSSTEYLENGVKTRSLTRYDYDTSNRLWRVTTDLSPEDSVIADGKVYTVTYGYDGAAVDARLNSIQQTDGSKVTIEYDANGRVQYVKDDQLRQIKFDYDTNARITTVTDHLNQATTLKYGVGNELLEIAGSVLGGSSFKQSYTYSAGGDLLTIKNAAGQTTTYAYDGPGGSNGAWTRCTDHAGNVIDRSYDVSSGLLLSETRYAIADADGVGTASQPGAGRKTQYFYDTTQIARRRLAYSLGPQGEVVRYVYNTLGQLERQVQYTAARFTAANPSFTSLEAWIAADPQALTLDRQITAYSYDLRGQVQEERRYTTETLVNGNSVADGGLLTTTYSYDASGRLAYRQDASGVTMSYSYDGLGRVTKAVDATLAQTLYTYDDAGRKTSIRLDNGQTTVQIFDTRGNLVSSDVLGVGSTESNPKWLGKTEYFYDALGRLFRTKDATGVNSYSLYEASGRKSADIAANGQLTEYFYDAAGRLIQSIAYATPLTQSKLDSLSETTTLATVRPAASTVLDRIITRYYDRAGLLSGVLDAEGYLTENQYDGTGALVAQVRRANVVAVTRLDVSLGTTQSAAPLRPSPSADAALDRTTRNLYDDSGRLVARVDADGGLSRWTYDAAGNVISQLRRSALLSDIQRASASLSELQGLVLLADDEFTQWVYDNAGRQIAQVDGEGYLTEYKFDAAGRPAGDIRYLSQAFKPVVAGSPPSLRLFKAADLTPALRASLSSPNAPLSTSRSYNNRGLLESETAADLTVTFYTYDSLQRLKTKTYAYNSSDAAAQSIDYDDWGRVSTTKVVGDATGVSTTYDAAGRRVSVKDARGNTTFYYYDGQGRQVYAILRDPTLGGEVTETIYSSFSEVQATVTHRERLSLNDVAGLTGGQAATARVSRAPAPDISLAEAIAALSKPSSDNRSSAVYNLRGLVTQAVDALGYKTDYSYNAFGQLRQEIRDIDPTGTAEPRRLTLDQAYDRRGNSIRTERSGSGLLNSVITGASFDALGRLYNTKDELNRITQYSYLRNSGSGRKVSLSGPAGSESTTYDALERVLTRVDRTYNTVTYTHDAASRKLTVKTAEGIQTVTEYTRRGQVCKITDGNGATTTYAYDKHGNLLTVTDAQGGVTQNGYDANDNLVQVIRGLKANASGDPISDGATTTTSYSFDAANRVLIQTVDPLVNGVGLNLQTSYAYDGQGRKLKITDPRGTVTTQVFNAKGELTDVIVDDVDGGLKLRTSYGYDAQSHVLTVVEGAGTGSARKTAYAYDPLGRRIAETVDPDGLKLKTLYEYDVAGRLTVKRDKQNNVIARYSYDNADRLRYSVDALGSVVRQDYDGEGRVTGVRAYATPLAAGWAAKTYDELRTALDALGTTAADALSVNVFDSDGRMLYAVDALGQVTERKYDRVGRVLIERQYGQPITGVTVGMGRTTVADKLLPLKDDAKDHVTRHIYDKAGNQRFVINAEGFVSEWRYDAAGRIVASVAHELPWTASVSSLPTEAELIAVYSPTRSEFNTSLEGFNNVAGIWETGRFKLISEAVADGAWAQTASSKQMPVGASVKFDVQPMQLQQSLHLMVCDATGVPGRVGLLLEANGHFLVEVQTPTAQYKAADIGTYTAGTTYTVEIESTAKGGKFYVYAKGATRASGVSYEATEPTLNWQTVRLEFAVKRAPTLPGQTVAYVDNVEEVPPLRGRVTQYAYDAAGRQRFALDAEGYVTETRYDDASARTTTLRYASRFGGGAIYTPAAFAPALKNFTDALASFGTATRTSRELDRAGRLSLESDGNDVQTRYKYDAAGRLESEERAINVSGQSSVTRYSYNAAGLRTETIRAYGTAQASTTRYAYDVLGRLSKTVDPRGIALAEGMGDWEKSERIRLGFPSDLSTLTTEARVATQAALLDSYTTEFRYDPAGRVKQVVRQVSSAISNATSTLIDSTDYDVFGNAVKMTDARGYSRYQVFDKLGRVTQEIDAESYLNVYTYDAFGNRLSSLRLDARVQGTIVAGQSVTVAATAPASGAYVISDTARDHLASREYDRNNRLLRETDAENYVEGSVGALNAYGERTTVRNKRGAGFSYTYDRLGRLLSETLPVQARDGSGALKDVINEYQYDSRGNRTVSIEAKGLPEQRTMQMRYDDANRLTTRIGMAYTALNADNTTSAVTPADTYRYDARGNLIEQVSHGQLQANGSVSGGKRSVTYYDALDRKVLQISADRAVTRSGYDVAGNLIEQTAYATRLADAVVIDPAGGIPAVTVEGANDRTYFHRYDELGREVETALSQLYAWDSGLTGNNLVISELTARRTVLQKFSYDAAGNLTEAQNGRGYSSYSYYDRLGRKVLAVDAAGAAIAWDYGRASGVATRETRYSGMLPGGYARQADMSAGLNGTNDPASLLALVKGLSTHIAADDRISEADLDRLDRVIEKRVLQVAQDFVDATGKRTKSTAAAITRYEYDGLGHVVKIKELAAQLGADQTWEVSDFYYDGLGREIERKGVAFIDWRGSSVRPTTAVEYSGLGDVARRIQRGPEDGVETDDRISRYVYDANGVLTRSIDPSGAATQYDYDARGGLVRRTNLGVLRSDGASRDLVHRYTLDAAGRIASETTFESDKPAQAETRKTRYNAFGEISAKGIGDGWEEFFEYSTLGKIIKTNTGDGAIKFYVYDSAGNQTREIKGNGDTNVNLRTMTLVEASTSNKLFSRVSIYDRRNLITQTIDPQIEVLKNTVSLSALYGQAWVPAFQISDPRLVPATILPNASVSIISGAQPKLYLTNAGSGYAVVSSTTSGVFWGETANSIGQPMPLDLSSLKGRGRYTLIYTTYRSGGGGGWYGDDLPLSMGRIDITVAADGNVTYNLLPPADSDRSPGYVKFPPPLSRPEQWTDYNIDTIIDGATVASGTYYSYYNTNWPDYCWAAVGVGQYRPASGYKDIFLHYSIAGTTTSGTVRVRINAAGELQWMANEADPNSLPVRFSLFGRDIPFAHITVTNRRTGATFSNYLSGVYTGATATTLANTTFTWDLQGYLVKGDELDYSLEPLEANYTAKLDEGGQALVQKGRIVMSNGSPSVLKEVITLNTSEQVTIKRFQDFNAFGEVSEERDERVGERMRAAINDDRKQKGLAALEALTPEQQEATRTALKYNTLGQLVLKLDPETFVTAENGYRYRARPETRYGYDLLGRLTTMQDANGNLSRVQYLAGSRGEDARVQREFDAAGDNADVYNVTGGGVRLNEYDIFGDSRRLTEALGSSEQRVTERAYDERGLLKSVIRKGVQRLVNGNSETLDAARDLTEGYTYDALGQRLKATNAINVTTRTDYDALGRVVQTVSGNSFVTSYSYSIRVAGQADGITGLAGAPLGGGYVLTTTRADGRSLKDKIDYFGHTTWHKDLAGTEFTYGFNSAGQLLTQTSTLGQNIEYVYYANGYIRGFKDNYLLLLSEYAYDNAGNRIYEGTFDSAKTHSWQSANITYDELNRISRVRDDNYFDVRYEFDAVGNRRRINSAYWDGLDGLRATQDYWYLYDRLNRFTISKGRLETAAGVATTSRGTSATDTSIVLRRGTEGVELGYDKLSQRRLATYTYQSGNVAQKVEEMYGYSQDGYLQTTKQGTTLVATRKLDDIGRTLLLTDLQNRQSTASSYDSDNRLLTQSFIGKIDNLSDTSGNYTLTYRYYTNIADSTSSDIGTGALASVAQQALSGSSVTTTYQYKYWDAEQQSKITKTAAGQESYTNLGYDINSHITSNYDSGTGVNRSYITNANGQVLRRSGTSGTHYFYYADGHRIGDVGNTPDDKSRVSYAEELAQRGSPETAAQRRERYTKPRPVTSADFDQNYEPINDNFPSNAAASYTVRRNGETLRDIAQAMWGDSSLWYLIAEANGMLGDSTLAAGRVLVIPNKVTNIHNNSTTWRPYIAGEAIGRVDPMLPQPPDFEHINPSDLAQSQKDHPGLNPMLWLQSHPNGDWESAPLYVQYEHYMEVTRGSYGAAGPMSFAGLDGNAIAGWLGLPTVAAMPGWAVGQRGWVDVSIQSISPSVAPYLVNSHTPDWLYSRPDDTTWIDRERFKRDSIAHSASPLTFAQDHAAREAASDPYGLSDFMSRTDGNGFTRHPLVNANEGYAAAIRYLDGQLFSGWFGDGYALPPSGISALSGVSGTPPSQRLDNRSLLNAVERGIQYLPYTYLARDGSGHNTPQTPVLVEGRRTISTAESYSLAVTLAGGFGVLGFGLDRDFTPEIASGAGGIEGVIARPAARTIVAGNDYLAASKHWVQDHLVKIGSWGRRQNNTFGSAVFYTAGAASVVDEIFHPDNVRDLILFGGGRALGVAADATINVLSKLPLLRADVGQGLRTAGQWTGQATSWSLNQATDLARGAAATAAWVGEQVAVAWGRFMRAAGNEARTFAEGTADYLAPRIEQYLNRAGASMYVLPPGFNSPKDVLRARIEANISESAKARGTSNFRSDAWYESRTPSDAFDPARGGMDWEHFLGELNGAGAAVGGHVANPRVVEVGPRVPVGDIGVYKVRPIEISGVTKVRGSTFFPDWWTEARIKYETYMAYSNKIFPDPVGNPRFWTGVSPGNVELAGYISPHVTAYPVR
jgi:YD repeat-containing protein